MAKMQDFSHTSIINEGSDIVLPASPRKCSKLEGASLLEQSAHDDEKKRKVHEVFEGFPLDGLVAFTRAFYTICGNIIAAPGKPAPTMLTIATDTDETITAPWGPLSAPAIKGFLSAGISGSKDHPLFSVEGSVRFADMHIVDRVIAETRKNLRENSIYKGKIFKLDLSWSDKNDVDFNPEIHAPVFQEGVDLSTLIFDKHIMDAINNSVLTPIEFSDAWQDAGFKLKRVVTLSGPYGCGKTLTAAAISKVAKANGWTFMYLKDVRHLELGLQYARRYEPCVVFCEDIDRVLSGARTSEMDAILNTIDGVDYKNARVFTIFTTNFLGVINPAALREGRMDNIIEIGPPSPKTAERFIRRYAGPSLDAFEDITTTKDLCVGMIPAALEEIVRLAKAPAIRRTGDAHAPITSTDLYQGASQVYQQKILKEESVKQHSTENATSNLICEVLEGLSAMFSSNNEILRDKRKVRKATAQIKHNATVNATVINSATDD